MSWWAGKVRRFVRYYFARVSPAERAELVGWLTPAQLELFDSMHHSDQRHGLDVVAALRREGHTDPDLLLAGLLHDCGKGRRINVWHRIAWSLVVRYGSGVRRLAELLPGFKPALAILADHDEASARLAQAAGASPMTVELIRREDPTGGEIGAALLRADQAN